jgi:type I restriction enzyme, S subunit
VIEVLDRAFDIAEKSHWQIKTLGEVCRTSSGGTPSRSRPDFFNGKIPWVKSGELTDGLVSEVSEFISEEALDSSSAKLLPAGTLLIAMYGATVGKLGVLARAAATNQAVCAIFPPPELDPKFLFWYLRRQRSHLIAKAVGGAQPNISQTILRDLELPIPPIGEQREIVAELEKQFSRLGDAVANLQRVKANLKRYKASVLKAAVEGRLVETEATRARREGRAYETAQELIQKTPTPPRPNRFNSRTGDVILGHAALAVGIPPTPVPEGWQWINLVEIAKMETGHTPSRGHPEWWDGDVPWIGIADARDHHERSILKTIQYTNSEGLVNSAARLLPAGAVCVSRTASVGYVVVMGKPMATSQDFVNWVPTTAVTSDWLRVVFTADRDALIRFGKGSVHKTIYFPEWLSASIALPPLAEQSRIVAEVDRHLSIIREVEAEVDANLQRAQALRQATLSKAFANK